MIGSPFSGLNKPVDSRLTIEIERCFFLCLCVVQNLLGKYQSVISHFFVLRCLDLSTEECLEAAVAASSTNPYSPGQISRHEGPL